MVALTCSFIVEPEYNLNNHVIVNVKNNYNNKES